MLWPLAVQQLQHFPPMPADLIGLVDGDRTGAGHPLPSNPITLGGDGYAGQPQTVDQGAG